jgi:peptidoglycan/xylan/chitin deacetylase (PgdA/CDA1 family)
MQDDGALVKALEEVLGVTVEAMETGDTFLSWDEVRTMATAGVAFGAHGVEHRLLGELPPAEADFEVRESKRVVSEQVGAPVMSLTYPNGSVTPAVRGMVEAAGYRAAFTTEPGPVSATDDRFMLRRVNVHEDMTASTPMFLARVVGLF